MDTNKGVNAGILAMRAALERKRALMATGNPAAGDEGTGGGERKAKPKAAKARSTKAAPLPQRAWLVTFVVEHEGKRGAWTCPQVMAPTIKRAVKGARQQARTLHPEYELGAVAGVLDRDLAKVGPIETA